MTPSKGQYICDTNIWVRVVLGKVFDAFFQNYNSLCFADGVENEIKKWSVNKDKFGEISSSFENYKNTAFNVIYLADLKTSEQKLIQRQLKQFGFTDLDNSKKTIKNLGEYISIVYAYFLEIPFLQTEDVEFYECIDLEKNFKGIQIITWNDIAAKITRSDKERIQLNSLIEQEQQQMNKKKIRANSMDEKLRRLQEKFNTR